MQTCALIVLCASVSFGNVYSSSSYFCSTNPCEEECTNLEGKGYVCSCKSGKAVNPENQKCEIMEKCATEVDVIFAIGSGSDSSTFKTLKQAVAKLVGDFEVGEENVRIGLLVFSDRVREVFNLDSYSNIDAAIEKLESTPHLVDNIEISNAVDYILEEDLFSEKYGGRLFVPSVLVVFADEESVESKFTKEAGEDLYIKNIHTIGVRVTHPIGSTAENPIGTGATISMKELEDLVQSDDDLFQDSHFLVDIERPLINRICSPTPLCR